MGANESKPGSRAAIPTEVPPMFDDKEIDRLRRRFCKLDTNKNGKLSMDEILQIEGLEQNPLVRRVIETFDQDKDGEVNFNEFLKGVSQFSVKSSKEDKLRFAFNIYDVDGDGYISNGELFTVLKIMVGENLGDVQLQQIVDKTIVYADYNGDGKISFEEFKTLVEPLDIQTKMTVDEIHRQPSESEAEEDENGIEHYVVDEGEYEGE